MQGHSQSRLAIQTVRLAMTLNILKLKTILNEQLCEIVSLNPHGATGL